MAELAFGIEEGYDLLENNDNESEGLEGEGGEGEGGEGEGDGHPSLSDIFGKGYPKEWIVLIILCSLMTLVMLFFFIRAVLEHKKYSTRHTMQFLSTMGILFVYPLFALMYVSGMVVPRANSKCTFIAETYESLSLMFFLKLMLTYMGGKKKSVKSLKGTKAHLNAPPLCCLPLPSVKFSAKYLFINELFVVQLIILELVLGYIDLLMNMDQSKSYPAALVEETYSHIFHGVSIASLCLSVYGLSSIYHGAEKELEKFNIFKKFVCYKIVVTLAKVQDIIFSLLSTNEVFGDLSKGAFTTHLRMHMWSSTLTIIECTVIFPLALKIFSTVDYPSDPDSHTPAKKQRDLIPSEKVHIDFNFDQDEAMHNHNSTLQKERGELGDVGYVKKVLFLTDSLLSTVSSSKFCHGLKCTKKGLYKLIDIRKYLAEFPFTDYVIISSGINDVHKYRTAPETLMKFSLEFYEECAKSCPRTKFVYVSLLQTNMEWVNNATDDYNTYIFELSLRFPNLLFFDNYQLVNRDILLEDGVQINEKAIRFISRTLVTAVTNLSMCYNDPADPWPLRPSFAQKALTFKSAAFIQNP